MPLILPGNVAAATASTAYSVANSCRFNDDDSPTLTKTSGDGSKQKWTFSCWFKLGSRTSYGAATNVEDHLISSNEGSNAFTIRIKEEGSDSTLEVFFYDGSSTTLQLITDMEFRDKAAWYHLVVATDTTQSTDTNRFKIYVNGTRITDFSTETYPAQNYDTIDINDGETLRIGHQTTSHYFDGYLAEVVLIDGTQYAVTSFGEFDSDSPTIWKPIDVSGLTFGTNGFYLDFEASANLGNDANGGTDFTEGNLAAVAQATDSPTNNFCVLNPASNYYEGATFAEGNCKATTKGSSYAYSTGTIGLTAGKWYWEVEVDSQTSLDFADIGISSRPPNATTDWLGLSSTSWGIYAGGDGYANNGSTTAWCDNFTDGDIISIALDIDNDKMYAAKNGSWSDGTNFGESDIGDADGIDITALASTEGGAWFPAIGYNEGGSSAAVFLCNFGGSSAFTVSSGNADANGYGNFEYAVPSGYLAICTKNLGSDGG